MREQAGQLILNKVDRIDQHYTNVACYLRAAPECKHQTMQMGCILNELFRRFV